MVMDMIRTRIDRFHSDRKAANGDVCSPGGRIRSRLSALVGVLAVLFLVMPAPLAAAHGEQSQQAFQRTATVTFYDVKFSTTTLDVNQELTITGNMRVMEAWPDHTIPPPEIGYLTINQPGPVFYVQEREMSDQFTPQSVKVHKGGEYPFKLVAKARIAGTWHIHPAMAMHGVGTLVGAGEWVTINDAGGPFVQEETLATGETVDMVNYGMGRVLTWTLIGFLLAAVYAAYWLRKPLLQRAEVVSAGLGETLVTKKERTVSIVIAVVALVVGLGGYTYATVADAPHIPIQVARVEPMPQEPSELAKGLKTSVQSAVFQEKTGNLLMTIIVTNNSKSPTVLDHLQFASYVMKVEAGDAPTPEVATVSPAGAISPGETRELTVKIDARELAKEKLLPFNEAQIKLTGMMFFRDEASGQTSTAEINEVTSGLLPDYST